MSQAAAGKLLFGFGAGEALVKEVKGGGNERAKLFGKGFGAGGGGATGAIHVERETDDNGRGLLPRDFSGDKAEKAFFVAGFKDGQRRGDPHLRVANGQTRASLTKIDGEVEHGRAIGDWRSGSEELGGSFR